MSSSNELARTLERLDGRGYKAYRDIQGAWRFGAFDLHVDHVQSDPFAAPSKMRVRIAQDVARLPGHGRANRVRRIASESYLARRMRASMRSLAPRRSGTGKSGVVTIDAGGQEVLERTAVVFGEDFVEARLEVGLPAAGRRILSRAAVDLLVDALPRIVASAWIDRDERVEAEFRHFVDCIENQEVVRGELATRGLVAFVGDGARLPRESGASDRPMATESTLPFESPESLRVEIEVPHGDAGAPGRTWRGMGLPRGVVLLVGGGYHGKSTLLRAIERGVVAHVPGDGRETVVSDPGLVKVRSEDGRSVCGVDIHGFIDHLPRAPDDSRDENARREDTHAFSTPDASGSTSQAANIIEAIEVGASGLLLDEDTSATNFLVRDARMKALVHPRDEPITPFVERVRELWEDFELSTLMVMGGSGEFFAVADTVVELKAYRPVDVTARARALVESESHPLDVARRSLSRPAPRVPIASSFDASRGRNPVKLSSRGRESITFGTTEIDLRGLDQLFDPSQTRAIAHAIRIAATRYMPDDRTLDELLDLLDDLFEDEGLDVLDPHRTRDERGDDRSRPHPGAFARPRRFEIAAAINRMRTLRVARFDP